MSERIHECPYCGTENEVPQDDDSYVCRDMDCEEIVHCDEEQEETQDEQEN